MIHKPPTPPPLSDTLNIHGKFKNFWARNEYSDIVTSKVQTVPAYRNMHALHSWQT
jgi:hypothetical protein